MIGVLHCLLLGIIIAQPATPLSRQDFITLRDTGHSPRKTGALKTLTVLVKHPKAEPHHTREEMERVIYQDLNAYVKSSSYGQAHLEGKAIGWYSIPELNLSGFNLFNKKIDPKGVHEFIKQVLDHAQDHEDVSKYDHLILVMGTRGRPYGFNGMAGPFEDLPFLLRNGKVIRHCSLYSEFAHLGQIAHDFFHQVGGTLGSGKWAVRERVCPCLYNNDLESTPGGFMGVKYFASYMGPWDVMSLHRIGMDIPPAGISSFTRMRLGWLPPQQVRTIGPGEKITRVVLSPLEDGGGETLAVKIPLSKDVYYLIENRQPLEYDRVLPAEGLIIYRVDESMVRDRSKVFHGPVRIMDADPSWPRFRSATFNLERPLFWDEDERVAVVVEAKEENRYQGLVLRNVRRLPPALAVKFRAARTKMSALAAIPTSEEARRIVTLRAKDGKTIKGEYYRAPNSKVAVLMVPGYDGSAESLHPLPYVFYRSGVTTLAIDLRTLPQFRAQVASGVALKGEFAPLPEDLTPALLDVAAGYRFLKDEGYEVIGVLGSSYGGTLALESAFTEEGIQAAAILSLPFGNQYGVNVTDDLSRGTRPELPLLFVYTTEDVVAPTVNTIAPALERFCRERGSKCRTIAFPGLSHGNDILRSHPDLEGKLIEWFKQTGG